MLMPRLNLRRDRDAATVLLHNVIESESIDAFARSCTRLLQLLIPNHSVCISFNDLQDFFPQLERDTQPVRCEPSAYPERYNLLNPTPPFLLQRIGIEQSTFHQQWRVMNPRTRELYYERFMSREGWNKYTEIHFWADRSLEATICVRRAPEQPDFSPAELRCLGDLRNTVAKAVHRLRTLHQERHTANALRELILRMPLPLVLLDWSLQPICFNFEARRACLEWTHGAEYARAMKSSMVPDLPLEIMRACAGQKRMMHGIPRKAPRFHPRFDTVPHPARSDLSAQVEVVEGEGTGRIWKNFLVRFQKTAGAPPVATAIAPTGPEAPLALLSCLTPCEREIALAVRDGRTNAEIGLQLYKCEATVKMQVHSIFRKLDVSNRTQLATLLH